jgi:hypothetical protein
MFRSKLGSIIGLNSQKFSCHNLLMRNNPAYRWLAVAVVALPFGNALRGNDARPDDAAPSLPPQADATPLFPSLIPDTIAGEAMRATAKLLPLVQDPHGKTWTGYIIGERHPDGQVKIIRPETPVNPNLILPIVILKLSDIRFDNHTTMQANARILAVDEIDKLPGSLLLQNDSIWRMAEKWHDDPANKGSQFFALAEIPGKPNHYRTIGEASVANPVSLMGFDAGSVSLGIDTTKPGPALIGSAPQILVIGDYELSANPDRPGQFVVGGKIRPLGKPGQNNAALLHYMAAITGAYMEIKGGRERLQTSEWPQELLNQTYTIEITDAQSVNGVAAPFAVKILGEVPDWAQHQALTNYRQKTALDNAPWAIEYRPDGTKEITGMTPGQKAAAIIDGTPFQPKPRANIRGR